VAQPPSLPPAQPSPAVLSREKHPSSPVGQASLPAADVPVGFGPVYPPPLVPRHRGPALWNPIQRAGFELPADLQRARLRWLRQAL